MKVRILLIVLAISMSACSNVRFVTGPKGEDGYSIVATSVNNPGLCGAAGGTAVYLALDTNRDLVFDDGDVVQTQYVSCNGTKGATGAQGLAGNSCTVNKIGSVATIECGSSIVSVKDGTAGATGAQGPAGTNASGIYIKQIIDPCGANFANDEVFLQLSTGQIIALYDGGDNQNRLTVLTSGNYITTDAAANHSCSFTVDSNNNVINQVQH